MTRFGSTIVALVLLSQAQVAQAHARSESYSNWDISGAEMIAVVTVSTGEIIAMMDPSNPQSIDQLLTDTLAETVTVRAGGTACRSLEPVVLTAPRGFERIELRFDCDGRDPDGFTYRALFDALPAHVHFARVYTDGSLLGEQVITDRADSWERTAAPLRHSFAAFFDLGVRHILAGIDHIAFLLGMLLIAGTPARSIAAITGFTLGHSVSLGAAVLGYVSANGRLVEAFIGFTVALVAVEYFALRQRSQRLLAGAVVVAAWGTGVAAVAAGTIGIGAANAYLGFGLFALCYLPASRYVSGAAGGAATATLLAVTTAFGLVHGFGFAGFLMDTGLSGESLFVPLLGFNLGVEAGQLILVGVAFGAAAVLGRTNVEKLAPITAASLCGVGVFWFVSRSLAA